MTFVWTFGGNMKPYSLQFRMNKERYDKIKLYSKLSGMTMTEVVEKMIDKLKMPPVSKKQEEE